MKSTKEWISISDLMTGLMIVFLFISILYMRKTQKQIEKIEKITKEYTDYKEKIYEELRKEFKEDLKKWKAEIVKESLIFRFLSPRVLFPPKQSKITPKFKTILSNFCPRYLEVLYKFKVVIEEVRIEGHTSKEWIPLSPKEAYFKNMELSQDRTRSVLHYCMNIEFDKEVKKWSKKRMTANGLSSSRPICKKQSLKKCREKNRRVEFRVQIKNSKVLDDIIRELSVKKNKKYKMNNKKLSLPNSGESKETSGKKLKQDQFSENIKKEIKQKLKFYKSDFGFEIQANNTNWIQTKPKSRFIETVYRSPIINNNVHASLTIRVDNMENKIDLKNYTKRWFKKYKKYGYDVLNSQPFKNGSQWGYVIDLINSSKSRQIRQVIHLRGKVAVILTCGDHKVTFNNSLKECNKFIKNFRWK